MSPKAYLDVSMSSRWTPSRTTTPPVATGSCCAASVGAAKTARTTRKRRAVMLSGAVALTIADRREEYSRRFVRCYLH